MPDNRWLTEEEKLTYEACKIMVRSGVGVSFTIQSAKAHIAALEALSACRGLSNEARDLFIWWIGSDEDSMRNCSKFREKVLALIDAWAAQLEGVEGGE